MIKNRKRSRLSMVPARSVYVMFCPNRGVPEGAGLRLVGSRRMASLGSGGTVLLEAAGAFAVALAGRRSWFCYHQVSRCCCGSGGAGPGWLTWPRWAGRFLGRAHMGTEGRGQLPLCGPAAGSGP